MKPSFPLILKGTSGPVFISLDRILRIDAEDKYARLHYIDGGSLVLLHGLHDLERRLACGQRCGDYLFLRTHRSCIAAMHHAKALQAKDRLEMAAGDAVPLRRGMRAKLLQLLGTIQQRRTAVRAA